MKRTPPGTGRVVRRDRRALWLSLLAVALAHGLVLTLLASLLRPPSLLVQVTAPLYTRTITVQAPAPVVASTPAPPTATPAGPSARIAPARKPAARKTIPRSGSEPTDAASSASGVAAAPVDPVEAPAASVPETDPVAEAPIEPGLPGETAAAQDGADNAPDAPAPDPLDAWPPDTRLAYRLGGNYRGELHGKAEVLWQREGARYQAVVQLDVGLLLSSRFTSQGAITARGLAPEVYEEQVRQRRRGVRLGTDSVRLDKGQRVPRPDGVQDAASQFVELSHRLASGALPLAAGTQVELWLARPGGVDEWTYDVVGEETLHLPRLGAVSAWHFKPRPLANPRGPITAEIWYAPSLQYLPVRIRLTQDADTWMDLMVETIEQH